MKTKNYAAIDIGSNAVRLLIKKVTVKENGETKFTKNILLRIPLRLGFDVFEKGEISLSICFSFFSFLVFLFLSF